MKTDRVNTAIIQIKEIAFSVISGIDSIVKKIKEAVSELLNPNQSTSNSPQPLDGLSPDSPKYEYFCANLDEVKSADPETRELLDAVNQTAQSKLETAQTKSRGIDLSKVEETVFDLEIGEIDPALTLPIGNKSTQGQPIGQFSSPAVEQESKEEIHSTPNAAAQTEGTSFVKKDEPDDPKDKQEVEQLIQKYQADLSPLVEEGERILEEEANSERKEFDVNENTETDSQKTTENFEQSTGPLAERETDEKETAVLDKKTTPIKTEISNQGRINLRKKTQENDIINELYKLAEEVTMHLESKYNTEFLSSGIDELIRKKMETRALMDIASANETARRQINKLSRPIDRLKAERIMRQLIIQKIEKLMIEKAKNPKLTSPEWISAMKSEQEKLQTRINQLDKLIRIKQAKK